MMTARILQRLLTQWGIKKVLELIAELEKFTKVVQKKNLARLLK
ncbi:MAG: hypothetical protein Ta2A_12050 [Treponemataceae bacterium]|nr:MAG: hypothetical protein Ta2A_12050 [Treponemataceae bacterium]